MCSSSYSEARPNPCIDIWEGTIQRFEIVMFSIKSNPRTRTTAWGRELPVAYETPIRWDLVERTSSTVAVDKDIENGREISRA